MGHTIGKGNFDDDDEELFPVSPGESGYGLPYAPVDFPNPGDIWRWAATGKALKQNGLFKDRILYVPERLQKRPSRKLGFMSKKSVENFLRSELPQVDINAFFQSFTWDIPAKTNPKTKENMVVTHTQSAPSQGVNKRPKRVVRVFKRTRQSSNSQERQKNTSDIMEIVDEGEDGSDSASASAEADGNICGSVPDCKLMTTTTTKNWSMEEFDNYINSLDEIVAGVNNDMFKKKNGGSFIFDARQRLSSLLAMGFPTLVTSNKLNELLCLASELKNDDDDQTLTQQEHSILNLIQEIPSVIPHYLEVKQSSSEADKFFVELESKIMDVNCLKNEYTNAKEEKEILQTEESSLLLSVMETNDEIEKLKSKRMELTETIKKTNKKIVECNCIQQKVMNCLPQLVQEVQIANKKKEEWQLKKNEFSQQENEILAKFAPFLGFSFLKQQL